MEPKLLMKMLQLTFTGGPANQERSLLSSVVMKNPTGWDSFLEHRLQGWRLLGEGPPVCPPPHPRASGTPSHITAPDSLVPKRAPGTEHRSLSRDVLSLTQDDSSSCHMVEIPSPKPIGCLLIFVWKVFTATFGGHLGNHKEQQVPCLELMNEE